MLLLICVSLNSQNTQLSLVVLTYKSRGHMVLNRIVSEFMDDEFLIKFKENLVKSATNKDNFIKFFYSSRSHVLVVLLVAYYGPKNFATFEMIISKIPNSVCSRSTIKSILDQGTFDKIFLKSVSLEDKRKQLYKLTSENQKKMFEWGKNYKEIFR